MQSDTFICTLTDDIVITEKEAYVVDCADCSHYQIGTFYCPHYTNKMGWGWTIEECTANIA